MSGDFVDASEVRAARKEEAEFTDEIELCEDSTRIAGAALASRL